MAKMPYRSVSDTKFRTVPNSRTCPLTVTGQFTFFTDANACIGCIGYSFNAGGIECRWT
jgi:hypothetical protein